MATAFTWYDRLIRNGRGALVYAGPMARFAVRHVRSGRTCASRLNGRDLMSSYHRNRTAATSRRPTSPSDAPRGSFVNPVWIPNDWRFSTKRG
ncbi:MAG: hypothetical protein JNK76_18310 [Planctomycetales bacterium]|nr:hypothetical protein [Planctomycetales bacterium]MBN8628191.1 hypothetical protein [Planctomycetota bacterium]